MHVRLLAIYSGVWPLTTNCPAKEVVLNSEGFIKAESSLGQGSVFHLFFPV